jgi:hypothetical protein
VHLKKVFIISFLFVLSVVAHAQEKLPNMSIKSQGGQVLLSWDCTFEGVKSISVQRSSDSTKNFTTVGFMNNPKKGIQSFRDEKPLAGKNFYRLYIMFPYELEWYSNTFNGYVDSSLIRKSTDVMKATTSTTTNNSTNTKTTTESTDFYYTPSSTIFTNPYTGHINIQLEDAASKRYSIRFFDPSRSEVLRLNRIQKTKLVLEKRNFNGRGTYSFQLFDGSSLVETGYVAIY